MKVMGRSTRPVHWRKLFTGPLVWNSNSQLLSRMRELVQKGIMMSMMSLEATSGGLRAI